MKINYFIIHFVIIWFLDHSMDVILMIEDVVLTMMHEEERSAQHHHCWLREIEMTFIRRQTYSIVLALSSCRLSASCAIVDA